MELSLTPTCVCVCLNAYKFDAISFFASASPLPRKICRPQFSRLLPLCKMNFSVILFSSILLGSCCVADDLTMKKDDIITGSNSQTFGAINTEVAGIRSSWIRQGPSAQVNNTFRLPGVPDVKYEATLSYNVTFEGITAEWIDDEIESRAKNLPSRTETLFRREWKALKARAGRNYYWFFQAAKDFGYSDSSDARALVRDPAFLSLNLQVNSFLQRQTEEPLSATSVLFSADTTSRNGGDRTTWYSYQEFYLNQIRLNSGKVLNVFRQRLPSDSGTDFILTD